MFYSYNLPALFLIASSVRSVDPFTLVHPVKIHQTHRYGFSSTYAYAPNKAVWFSLMQARI